MRKYLWPFRLLQKRTFKFDHWFEVYFVHGLNRDMNIYVSGLKKKNPVVCNKEN